ncbi:methionyl-tRNA formyltransferase [bacterium]|nr:methionyl-tRNA formyltransferase [bacterium]
MENTEQKVYKKRVLFVGMPDMALVCLHKLVDKKINIVGVVPPNKKDSTYNMMVRTALVLGLNVIPYNENLLEEDFLQKIKDLNADIGVVCSYNSKLPEKLLALTKDGFINLHPSLLPDYRGGNPYAHVIINGEKESAITLHFMDKEFDTGDIISQYKFPLMENETMGTLFYRTNDMCASMLFEALDYYEDNPFPRRPQEVRETYKKAPSLSFEKGNVFIDWTKSAEEIERFIRALNPFIGAFTFYNGTLIRVNSASVIKKFHNFEAGEIIDTNKCLKIACGQDVIEIESMQFGAYFISTGKDFVQRIEVKKGEKLKSGQA